MGSIAKPKFTRAVVDLLLAAEGTSKRKSLRDGFVKGLLAFGSETPDNQSCADNIDYGVFKDSSTSRRVLALGSKKSRTRLSDLAWHVEGTKVPARIRSAFPGLTVREWEAFQRLTTMIFLALEQELPSRPSRRRSSATPERRSQMRKNSGKGA